MTRGVAGSGDAPFAAKLLGWKQARKALVPNTADSDNAASREIAAAILDQIGIGRGQPSGVANSQSGRPLERAVAETLARDLPVLDADRGWIINDLSHPITDFLQYTHLQRVDRLVKENAELRTTLGTDYIIRPDVVVGLPSRSSDDPPFLHAAVSCKWTIRSDRVQNIRHENNQMIRHRRERLPHLVTVTAEPLPSRLAAIARGTGEVDAVYHIAFDALAASIASLGSAGRITKDQIDSWHEVTTQGRVRPYSDLAPTLAYW
ncbi:restriction endonuclease [Gordonia sputi]|uniref:NgoMIV family type II restriction endonuclease n=1 Tax=Gordonia sputi TaxID=36823 RepID=UPI002043DC0F|nr:NgoMIV family type II restriction endonuclease [Gordonia sputi]MCM3895787.1 restriction endonuclease [Gordonia sputi]